MGPRYKVRSHQLTGQLTGEVWIIIDTLDGDKPCRDKTRHIRRFLSFNKAVAACELMNQGNAEANDPNHPFNAGMEGESNGPAQTSEPTNLPEVSEAGDRHDQCIGCPCCRRPWNQGSDYCDSCIEDERTGRDHTEPASQEQVEQGNLASPPDYYDEPEER